jgi:hypothetical protein
MTLDAQPMIGEGDLGTSQRVPEGASSHQVIDYWFARRALRRRRWLWVGLAVVGLLIGVAFHVVIPVKYAATAKLYLADPPAGNADTVSANDLALLQTAAVGQRAINALGEHDLKPIQLLGKAPGTTISANVMGVTIDGPTPREAIRRVNAVSAAFLAFRAEQYGAQTDAIDDGLNQQISSLEAQVTSLTAIINGNSPIPQGESLTDVITDRATDSGSIITLEQTEQQNQAGELSVTKGSRVLSPGTVTSHKKIVVFALDGASGLIGGLGLGIGIVLIAAFLSDRLWRREDIAAVLGAPVDLSVGRVRLPRKRRSLLAAAEKPSAPIQAIVHYLRNLLPTVGTGQTLLLVALDGVDVAAVSAATLAGRLTAEGKTVVLADLTGDKTLAHIFGIDQEGRHQVTVGHDEQVILLVPPGAWRLEESEPSNPPVRWSNADVILAVATVDPNVGAWHLLPWSTRSTVIVSAGKSSARRINGTAELLRAASIDITSAVLVNVDRNDDSIGLSDRGDSPLHEPGGTLSQSAPPTWT